MDHQNTDTNLPNTIAQQIIAYIQHHDLKRGDKLPSERVFSQMFNVSRVSLREAIRGLVMINLIEVKNGKGAFVKNPKAEVTGANLQINIHKDQLLHLTEVRAVLEKHSLKLIVDSFEEDDLLEIEQILHNMEYEFVLDEELGRLDDQFHIKLNQLCGNEVLVDLLESTIILSKQLWAETGRDIYKAVRDSVPLHRELLDAIRSGKIKPVLAVYERIVSLDTQLIQSTD